MVSGSCLKIIACGSDTVVNEDGFERIESKGSTDKRGWSFRKRSDRHRGIGTTILEDSSLGNKENPEPASIIIADKISAQRINETILLSSELTPKAPNHLVLTENTCNNPIILKENLSEPGSLNITKDAADIHPKMEETFAIAIQAAIRGYLSQKALSKIKNVVKLQAAVRGHLVRNQAVGTLRCVQAIIKVQALVRAHRLRISLEGSVDDVKLADGVQRENESTTLLGKEIKANPSSCCTEKILGNVFARKLLESTPKKKPIHIKCDPLRPDSAWKWLERWMSASSSDCAQPPKPQSNQNSEDQERLVYDTACGLRTEAPAETDLESSPRETAINPDTDENSANDADNFDFQFRNPTTSLTSDECHGFDLSEAEETSSKMCINQTELPLNVASEAKLDSKQPDTEGKKIVVGSRKGCNPAFVAAQSKFKELSSTGTSSIMSTSSKDTGVDLKINNPSSPADSQIKKAETTTSDNSISCDPRNEVGEDGSEDAEEVISDVNRSNGNPSSLENIDIGSPALVQPGGLEVDSVGDAERSGSDVQIGPDIAIDQPAYRSSPEGSPRSRVTVSESHGTPSSQVSVKAKGKEDNSSDRPQKRKSKSTDKRPPSNPNQDSGMKNMMEKLSKESKNGKRRNSFSSVKTDYAEQESCLPSYMQATESARAKAQANNSPRSSPDIQESDVYIKKRHSLPSANGKLGSPRMPSSSPQGQQTAKGDNSSRDRWQR